MKHKKADAAYHSMVATAEALGQHWLNGNKKHVLAVMHNGGPRYIAALAVEIYRHLSIISVGAHVEFQQQLNLKMEEEACQP